MRISSPETNFSIFFYYYFLITIAIQLNSCSDDDMGLEYRGLLVRLDHEPKKDSLRSMSKNFLNFFLAVSISTWNSHRNDLELNYLIKNLS